MDSLLCFNLTIVDAFHIRSIEHEQSEESIFPHLSIASLTIRENARVHDTQQLSIAFGHLPLSLFHISLRVLGQSTPLARS